MDRDSPYMPQEDEVQTSKATAESLMDFSGNIVVSVGAWRGGVPFILATA